MLDSGMDGLGRRILSTAKDVAAPGAGLSVETVAAMLATAMSCRR